jgi:transcriptional regulator with XRE-family HTH domain
VLRTPPIGDRMPPTDLSSLGLRIRAERERQGVSLRTLAREVGVSASMISQIETAKSRPSVSTLYAITSALGMSIEDVFRPPDGGTESPASVDVVTPGAGLAALVELGRLPALVRPSDRQILRLDSGVTWERLSEVPGQPIDFLLVTYAPGGMSSGSGEPMRHGGAEYGFLLSGALVLTLGTELIEVRAGDSFSFESTIPHGYRNDGTEAAVGVWFVMERCFPEVPS